MNQHQPKSFLIVAILLALPTFAMVGCDESATPDAGAAAPAEPAVAPSGINTMALSELARWHVEGFDEATAANLESIEGVKLVAADAQAQTVFFKWSPKHTSEEAIKEALAANGYVASAVDPTQGQVSYVIEAPKLHCGACVKGVQGVIAKLDGVELDRISVADHQVVVRLASAETDGEAVIAAMNNAGFVAQPATKPEAAGEKEATADSE